MEIIIGYFLGVFVLVIFFISLFKMVSNRMKNAKSELNEKVDNLDKRLEKLENK